MMILVSLALALTGMAAFQPPQDVPTDPVEMPVPRAEPAPDAEPALPVKALVGATVIPGDGSEAILDGVILVQGSSIVAVGDREEVVVPEGAQITNLSGKFVMPGLIDSHVHFFQSGGLYARPDVFDLRDIVPYEEENKRVRASLDSNFQRYLAAGVTSVFDAGGPNWNFEVRQAAKGSRAPRVAVAGPLIATEPTPRQERMIVGDDQPIISATTPEDAGNLARALIPFDPDAIKIWGIGRGNEGSARIEAMTAAVAEVAAVTDIQVAVHATELATAKAALRGGANVLVHSIDNEPVDEEFIALLKEKDATLITAMVVFEGYADAAAGRPDLHTEERRLADPAVLASLYAMPGDLQRDQSLATAERLNLARENAKTLSDAGVRVAMGTDAGNVGTLHGGSVFRELEILESAGIEPSEIIKMATWNAAHALEATPDFGAIRPGMSADLIVLGSNPLETVQNIASLETVWLRGRAIERRSLIPRTPEAIVQEQLEAYNRQDLMAFAATFSEDVEIFNLPNTSDIQINGIQQLREVYGRLFSLPDDEKIRCDVVERIVEGNFVIDQERCRSIDGRRIRARATAIYQVEGGEINRVWFAR